MDKGGNLYVQKNANLLLCPDAYWGKFTSAIRRDILPGIPFQQYRGRWNRPCAACYERWGPGYGGGDGRHSDRCDVPGSGGTGA